MALSAFSSSAVESGPRRSRAQRSSGFAAEGPGAGCEALPASGASSCTRSDPGDARPRFNFCTFFFLYIKGSVKRPDLTIILVRVFTG